MWGGSRLMVEHTCRREQEQELHGALALLQLKAKAARYALCSWPWMYFWRAGEHTMSMTHHCSLETGRGMLYLDCI